MADGKLLTLEILRELFAYRSLRRTRSQECNLTHRFPDVPGLEDYDRFTEDAAEMLGCLGEPPYSMSYNYPGIRELPLNVAARLRFANAMAIELNGLKTISAELMHFLVHRSDSVVLNGIEELTAEHAECIRNCGIVSFDLHGLKNLPGPIARILSKKPYALPLCMFGIQRLSDETCRYLGRIQGSLKIPAVKELSDAAIRSLCRKKQGMLDLSGLQELSYVAAEALADYDDGLILDGLEELPESIAALFGDRTKSLSLKGLRTISPEVAEAIAGHVGELNLDGIATLCPEAARALSRHRGSISFAGLESIPDDTARELAKYSEMNLNLKGLKRFPSPFLESTSSWLRNVVRMTRLNEIDEAVARKLCSIDFFFSFFNGLKSISVPVARELAQRSKPLELKGLETLSEDVALALAEHQGALSLDGLKTISEEAARALIGHKGNFYLFGLTSLSARVAAALADRSAILTFCSLANLSDEAATELSSNLGELIFYELTFVSDHAAMALSEHRGESLEFWKRLRISDRGMESLSKYRGRLFLWEIDSFSEAAQNSMAQFRGKLGHIPFPQRLTSVPFAERCLRDHWMFWDALSYDDAPSYVSIDSEMISDEITRLIADRFQPCGSEKLNLYLTELSEEAARHWAAFPTRTLQFVRLEYLTPEAAGNLAKFSGERMTFEVLSVESSEVLKALMTYKGCLVLERVFETDIQRASILSTFEGSNLSLLNVWTMSDDAAETLSKSRLKELSARRLQDLSNKGARAFARFEGELDFPAPIMRRIDRYR